MTGLRPIWTAGLLWIAAVGGVDADVLTLTDGTVIEGEYAGGTVNTLRMKVGGELRNFAIEDVGTLTVNKAVKTATPRRPVERPRRPEPEPDVPPAPPPPAAVRADPPAPDRAESRIAEVTPVPEETDRNAIDPVVAPPAPSPAVLPRGTRLMVRLSQDLVADQHTAGYRFTTELEGALSAGGITFADRGEDVLGVVVKTSKREITVELTDLLMDDQLVPIATEPIELEAVRKGSSGRGGVGSAAGSAVGPAASGDAASAGASLLGSTLSMGSKRSVSLVPRGTLIEFQLSEALRQE